jgi:hypothetical protein
MAKSSVLAQFTYVLVGNVMFSSTGCSSCLGRICLC